MSDNQAEVAKDRLFFFEQQEVIVEDFAASGFILDVGGGGEGVIGQLKGERVVTIDPNRRELEEAAPGPLKIIMDARDLQFLDGTFSVVTSFFTMMYIKGVDHGQVFREVFRVLAPGGRFLMWGVSLPRRQDEERDIAVFPVKVKIPGKEISTGYGTEWPEEEQDLEYYVRVAEKVGFEVGERSERGRAIYLELIRS